MLNYIHDQQTDILNKSSEFLSTIILLIIFKCFYVCVFLIISLALKVL